MKAFVGKLQKKVDRKALGGGGEGESVRMSTGNKARKAALDSCVASVTRSALGCKGNTHTCIEIDTANECLDLVPPFKLLSIMERTGSSQEDRNHPRTVVVGEAAQSQSCSPECVSPRGM